MPWRVSWSGLDDHRSVSEYVVVILGNEDGFAVLEFAEVRWLCARRRRIHKHDVALLFSYQPGGSREQVGVSDVVPVKMRISQVGNIGGPITDLGELRFQRLPRRRVAECSRTSSGLEVAVGDSA